MVTATGRRVARAVSKALDQSGVRKTRLLLENTAGQGTCLGASLQELSFGIDLIDRKEQLGICLDTCHLFAAGHDYLSESSYLSLKEQISQTIKIRNVRVIHLNDSAKPFGSHVDNHAGIGKGQIGSKPFRNWINDKSWKNVLGILETPGGEQNYKRELRLLKRMRAQ